jgi:hypothetical protein
MDIDHQIKVASYNELEKVAFKGMLTSARSGLGRAYEGARSMVQDAAESAALIGAVGLEGSQAVKGWDNMSRALNSSVGYTTPRMNIANFIRGLAKKNAAKSDIEAGLAIGNLRAEVLARLASENAGRNILAGGGVLGAGGLAYGALGGTDESDEPQPQPQPQAPAADEAASRRRRNLALALGGTALAGGLGYGAYKALS